MKSKNVKMVLPYILAMANNGDLFKCTHSYTEGPQRRVKTKYDYEQIESAKRKRAIRATKRLKFMEAQ